MEPLSKNEALLFVSWACEEDIIGWARIYHCRCYNWPNFLKQGMKRLLIKMFWRNQCPPLLTQKQGISDLITLARRMEEVLPIRFYKGRFKSISLENAWFGTSSAKKNPFWLFKQLKCHKWAYRSLAICLNQAEKGESFTFKIVGERVQNDFYPIVILNSGAHWNDS